MYIVSLLCAQDIINNIQDSSALGKFVSLVADTAIPTRDPKHGKKVHYQPIYWAVK